MRFDLTDLRLFVAVAEAGSISRGAGIAHMALASASERISGMERMLGVPLLERGRRGVTPTGAGRTLLQHARAVTAQVEQMRGELRAFSEGLRGAVRMLSNTAGLVDIVPAALQTFLALHPAVDVDLEERTSAEIVLAVAEGRAEFGVVAGSSDPGPLQVRPLGTDRLVVIAAATHPLAPRASVDFAELLGEAFVGLSSGALHDHLAAQAARYGRRLASRVRLRSFEAIARLVEAGVGLAILPEAAAAPHLGNGLVAIRLNDAWASRRLLVCAIDFDALTTHARALVAELERQASAGEHSTPEVAARQRDVPPRDGLQGDDAG
ncbi:LysR family transcriptional regulator [Rhodopseudomonas sp. HC1]|uniref:LysR family transcriptional regulator n=1 Tax=Rhodopseudomonas infernalis TaxID=2897386 RepID=UPI001EE862CA|nr:LysR family transcriptional regulator [Rhodopseudomonas infernalis]MCG6207528.1 LysR family transcriptional regulator [Rhodopseudomonas infernalis]